MTDARRMIPFVRAEHDAWPPHGETGYVQVDGKPRQKLSGYFHPAKMNRTQRREAWANLTSRDGRMKVRALRRPPFKLTPKEER